MLAKGSGPNVEAGKSGRMWGFHDKSCEKRSPRVIAWASGKIG
jgi:hypothetical protein